MRAEQPYGLIKAAFLAACGLSPTGRERILQESFGDDLDSRNRVSHLLALASRNCDGDAAPDGLELPGEFELLLNRYRIEAPLGQGGHGAVYLAEDQRVPGRRVVAKIIENSGGSNWMAAKFRDEVTSLARVDHPGVVGIIDCGETARGLTFLVMRYVPGETLRSRLLTGPMITPEEVAALVEKMADALAAIHSAGVIHRDLKPENVILRPDGQPVIVDLGIASLCDKENDEHVTPPAGSANYMAPEARLGRPSRQSDVFSLAVMAAELLKGVNPDKRVRNILAKGMAASEAERYVAASQFSRRLSTALRRTNRPLRRKALSALPWLASLSMVCGLLWISAPQRLRGTSGGTVVTPGNLLIPVVKPNEIDEFDPRKRMVIRTFDLPRAFTMDHTVPAVLVRKRDSAILINARDSEERPAILEFNASGVFQRAQRVPGLFAQPLIFDPADPSEDIVLTSLVARPRIVAVDMRRHKTSVRLELGWGKYLGLAVDAGGNLYAADFDTGKIRRFSITGRDQGIFAQADESAVTCLSFDGTGNLYVAEGRLRRLLKFSKEGRLILRIESPLLQAPHAIFHNPADQLLYIGDWASRDLLVFSPRGDFLYASEMNGRAPSVPGLVPFHDRN